MPIRAINPESPEEIALVAARMEGTLAEVIGEEVGRGMYSRPWLEERVLFHLDGEQCTGAVFVAELESDIAGHLMVRKDRWQGRSIGLISTVYVVPEQRRHGLASSLVDHAESWFRAQSLALSQTCTAISNAPLRSLLEARGYQVVDRSADMVRLSRSL